MKKKKKRKRGSEIEMLFFIHVSKKNKKEHGSDLHCYAHRFFFYLSIFDQFLF
jgi:hypothetical protein